MMSIPSYLAAELGLNSCELPEDELEGRMLLAGITKGSDVFNSPLLDTVTKEPRVFTDFVLPLLDTGDMMILARVNKTMRRIVKVHTYTTVVTDMMKEDILGVPTFVRSVALLRWARENGCPWDERTCATAAAGGQLEVLQWARENGCPWDERTCAAAAAGQYLEVLQWALENSCPSGIDSLLLWAKDLQKNILYSDADDLIGHFWDCSDFYDKVKNFEPTATTAGRDYSEILQRAFENGFDQKELRRVSKLRILGISEDKLKVFERRLSNLFESRPSNLFGDDEIYNASASWLEAGRITRRDFENILSHMEEFTYRWTVDKTRGVVVRPSLEGDQ
jgi:uncharacterized protein (UPF0335 family)